VSKRLAVAALFACMSCSDAEAPKLSELQTAPEAIVVSGSAFSLKAELWRDFMPVAPPNGQPLAVIGQLCSLDKAVPPNLTIDRVWVVFGNETWTAAIDHVVEVTSTTCGAQFSAGGGPKWGPGVNVDVIVRVRESVGRSTLLRAANQPIGRTD